MTKVIAILFQQDQEKTLNKGLLALKKAIPKKVEDKIMKCVFMKERTFFFSIRIFINCGGHAYVMTLV